MKNKLPFYELFWTVSEIKQIDKHTALDQREDHRFSLKNDSSLQRYESKAVQV